MYFSVITPAENSRRQAAYELAQSPYAEHQWLWQFFPSGEEQRRDFIFRRHALAQIPHFYVVSKRAPTAFSDAWQIQSRLYDPQLKVGQRLSFQLCANPVVTRKSESGKSQRHDVVMQAKRQKLAEHGLSLDAKWRSLPDQDSKPLLYELVQESCMDWLKTRAGNHGFTVTAAAVDAYQQNRAGKRDIRFSSVEFSGELAVSDPTLFQRVLFNGLGHAKAFGCGLFLVKRMESD
jgi:CRISPR system Cascade subunit CasE